MKSKNRYILNRNLYENCKVRNLEGDVIFFCSTKRAKWYLNRNLAAVLNEEPFEIQLNFKANGDGNKNDKFYLQHRKNICVVCGTDKQLTRHHVVPYAFRKFLPANVKDHSFHDILLLCIDCHERYEHHAYEFKKALGVEYNAPLDGVVYDKNYAEKYAARGYARTLLKHKDSIPLPRRDILIEKIRQIMNTDNIEEVAKIPLEMDVKSQGEIIVSQLTDINSFLYRWREHFVETMEPAFLPEHWSVERGQR